MKKHLLFWANGPLLAFFAMALFSANDGGMKFIQSNFTIMQAVMIGALGNLFALVLLGIYLKDWRSFIPKDFKKAFFYSANYFTSVLCVTFLLGAMAWIDFQIIAFCLPILATLMGKFMLREHITHRQIIAIVLAVFGVSISAEAWLLFLDQNRMDYPVFVYGVALLWLALFIQRSFMLKTWLAEEKPYALSIITCVGILFFCGLTGTTSNLTFSQNSFEILVGLIAGSFAAVGTWLYIRAQQIAPLSIIIPMVYSQIIWVTIFGWLIWGEIPDGYTITGCALVVLAGLILFAKLPKNFLLKRNLVE